MIGMHPLHCPLAQGNDLTIDIDHAFGLEVLDPTISDLFVLGREVYGIINVHLLLTQSSDVHVEHHIPSVFIEDISWKVTIAKRSKRHLRLCQIEATIERGHHVLQFDPKTIGAKWQEVYNPPVAASA